MIIFKKIKITISVALCLLLTPAVYAETQYKIKSTDTLSRIVAKFYKGSELTQHQIYIALLAESPNAFGYGNINYLKGSEYLLIPDAEILLVMEEVDANRLVSEHNLLAKKGKKVKLDPPFIAYKPKKNNPSKNKTGSIANKQQVTTEKLEQLDSETEQLRIRIKRLMEDKEAMDAELQQLNKLITK